MTPEETGRSWKELAHERGMSISKYKREFKTPSASHTDRPSVVKYHEKKRKWRAAWKAGTLQHVCIVIMSCRLCNVDMYAATACVCFRVPAPVLVCVGTVRGCACVRVVVCVCVLVWVDVSVCACA